MSARIKSLLLRRTYILFLAPPLLVVTIFLLFPLLILLQYSFRLSVPGEGMKMIFTLSNYMRFFTDAYYLNGLWITLGTGFVVVVVTLLFAYPVAYFYAKTHMRHRGILLVMLLSPFYTNVIIKIFSWMVLLGRQGIVNKLLVSFNLLDRPFEFLYSYIGVIIIMVYIHIPMMTLLLIGSIQNIRDSLIESARIYCIYLCHCRLYHTPHGRRGLGEAVYFGDDVHAYECHTELVLCFCHRGYLNHHFPHYDRNIFKNHQIHETGGLDQ